MHYLLFCLLIILHFGSYSQAPQKAFIDYRGKDKVSVNKQQILSNSDKPKRSLNPLKKSLKSNSDKENKRRSKKLMKQIKKDKRKARRNKD